ncbi:hypothetical protein [Robertmurraya sp.]|uniref:hypothetical protein n=1 Tax=Robertmurraya sp. TaxID=2837525 RepID=UPI003703F0CC
MANQTQIKSSFSPVTGSKTRRCYSKLDGSFIGIIIKVKQGYEVRRFPDGKVRVKPTLAQAFASISRSN